MDFIKWNNLNNHLTHDLDATQFRTNLIRLAASAPVVGMIGASFMEQWKANRIQWETLENEKDFERLKLLWKLYDAKELNSKRN